MYKLQMIKDRQIPYTSYIFVESLRLNNKNIIWGIIFGFPFEVLKRNQIIEFDNDIDIESNLEKLIIVFENIFNNGYYKEYKGLVTNGVIHQYPFTSVKCDTQDILFFDEHISDIEKIKTNSEISDIINNTELFKIKSNFFIG